MAKNTNHRGNQAVADDVLSNNDILSHNDNSVDNSVDTDTNVKVEDSFQDNSDNSTNTKVDVDVDVEDSFKDQSDNSTNVKVEDSFKDQSDNSTNVKIEDSFKDQSDNSTNVDVDVKDSFNTDNSTDDDIVDSFNKSWDNSVRNQDSFNVTSSFNTQTLNDHSTTIGVRQYNAGFGDFNVGGLLGGGASSLQTAKGAGGHGAGAGLELDLDNRSLQVDQSVNQVIQTGDGSGVTQAFAQNATVAFGDDSIAAGRDVSIDNSVFEWKMGDVNIGNTAIDTRINDSFNDFSKNYDLDFELEVEDSFNDQSTNTNLDLEIEDSFTSEIDNTFSKSIEWENSGNLFSPGAAAGGSEVETEIDF